MAKRRITAGKMLEFASDMVEVFFPMKRESLDTVLHKSLPVIDDYFPSIVKQVANKLQRKGWVEKKETPEGFVIKITDKGRIQTLKFKLAEMKPPKVRWDGKWRMVFFDIAELERGKRDRLRIYLRQLGMERMQESVWVSPYDVFDQVKYLEVEPVETIITSIEKEKPTLAIIDSIQTMLLENAEALPGTPTAVRAATDEIISFAKLFAEAIYRVSEGKSLSALFS